MKYSPTLQKIGIHLLNFIYKIAYRVTVTGRENVPEGGCLVCANHPSLHDIFFALLGLGTKHRVGAMGKKELFKIKICSSFFKSLGAFPVDRGNSDIKAIKSCIEVVNQGRKLIVFPEGTVTKRSGKKAKAGIGFIALKANCPILPIYISQEIRLFHKTNVIVGPPIYPPETKVDSQEFAQYILDEIFQLGDQYEHRSC